MKEIDIRGERGGCQCKREISEGAGVADKQDATRENELSLLFAAGKRQVTAVLHWGEEGRQRYASLESWQGGTAGLG